MTVNDYNQIKAYLNKPEQTVIDDITEHLHPHDLPEDPNLPAPRTLEEYARFDGNLPVYQRFLLCKEILRQNEPLYRRWAEQHAPEEINTYQESIERIQGFFENPVRKEMNQLTERLDGLFERVYESAGQQSTNRHERRLTEPLFACAAGALTDIRDFNDGVISHLTRLTDFIHIYDMTGLVYEQIKQQDPDAYLGVHGERNSVLEEQQHERIYQTIIHRIWNNFCTRLPIKDATTATLWIDPDTNIDPSYDKTEDAPELADLFEDDINGEEYTFDPLAELEKREQQELDIYLQTGDIGTLPDEDNE